MFPFLEPTIPNYLSSRLGIYFHIPFCPHICPYCDFTKTSRFTPRDVKSYFFHLKAQLIAFLDRVDYPTGKSVTVYFGGGTPGLFPASFFEPLLDEIRDKYVIEECTLETNPFTNQQKRFLEYKSVGIHRVTLGAQSLCSDALTFLGRRHSPQQIIANIHALRTSGIDDVQVDLIYGLRLGTRKKSISDEIYELKNAGATGVSCYALTTEEGTLFSTSNQSFEDEAEACADYRKIRNTTDDCGWFAWETSNFSQTPPKHNMIYWSGLPYIGCGTGASGLIPAAHQPYGNRYRVGPENHKMIALGDAQLKFQESKDCDENFSIFWEDEQGRSSRKFLQEFVMTRMRSHTGLPLDFCDKRFPDLNISEKIKNSAKFRRALDEGILLIENQNLILPPAERIRGNLWIRECLSFIT